DFDRAEEMYIPVQDDPMCRGMVIWSENSHSNPLLLEYLAKRSADEPFSFGQFCTDRYGDRAAAMQELWELTKPAFACNSWVFGTERVYEGICCNHFHLLGYFAAIAKRKPAELYSECSRKFERLEVPDSFFEKAAELAAIPDLSELLRRDLADLIRSTLMCRITRELCLQTMKIVSRTPEQASGEELYRLITAMGDLLEKLPEFSLNDTLDRMKRAAKLNSHAEQTLKSNAENGYCRSYIYELYRAVYEPEARCLKDYLTTLKPGDLPDREFLLGQYEKIRDRFYAEPLARFRPKNGDPKNFSDFFEKALDF
ncbi:MAG: hypothetical protein IKO93_05720, partial [Lentisphaeria bacterium]|nr:hypothetical protein [Lentisphaeria bacterium]